MWYKNFAGRFFGLVTKHACERQTGRQTDGQNYDSQDCASIAASRVKNCLWAEPPVGFRGTAWSEAKPLKLKALKQLHT